MKSNKGLLMGIAAMALLFSMAFLGCESATNGAPGAPGDGRGLEQYFKISSDITGVVILGSTKNTFTAFYNGINITPRDEISWKVTGEYFDYATPTLDPVTGLDTGRHSGTTISLNTDGTMNLVVDSGELSPTLTVTATYGGYDDYLKFEVGVPRIVGLDLMAGTEIGTTNIYDVGTYVSGLPAVIETYLVYSIDPKEVTEVKVDQDISTLTLKTAKVNPSTSVTPPTAAFDYNVVMPQEKWLTIYEVPVSDGHPESTYHINARAFVSIQATEPGNGGGTSKVLLPLFVPAVPGVPAPSVTFNSAPYEGLTTISNPSFTLTGKTTSAHGVINTTYAAYAVYYDPDAGYGWEDSTGKPGEYPALNTRFVPPSGSQPIPSTSGTIPVNRTGTWKVIVQYTGSDEKTGNGAWSYFNDFTVLDASSFSPEIAWFDNGANTVHITLIDKNWAAGIDAGGSWGTYFGGSIGDVVNISRDSDTGLTMYLNNTVRTGKPTITISNQAFATGTTPRAVAETAAFIKASSNKQKYDSIIIGTATPPPLTFQAGLITAITIAHAQNPLVSGSSFPYGEPSVSFNGEDATEVGYNVIWYYVDGSTWTETGTTGLSFQPTAEDAAQERTIGIRVNALGNKPDVMLMDISTDSVTGVTKWSTIGYGQRILGHVEKN